MRMITRWRCAIRIHNIDAKPMMKERPILFKGEMVQAILEGRKTQTRRIMKPQPQTFGGIPIFISDRIDDGNITKNDKPKCPYGYPGDMLWVKETHFLFGRWYRNGKTKKGITKWKFEYRRDFGVQFPGSFRPPLGLKRKDWGWRKRPSIFMPRWASRINLLIIKNRVEMLKDICESDAWAEGCTTIMPHPVHADLSGIFPSNVDAYHWLWERINGLKSWDANPFVWVIEFKRVRP